MNKERYMLIRIIIELLGKFKKILQTVPITNIGPGVEHIDISFDAWCLVSLLLRYISQTDLLPIG